MADAKLGRINRLTVVKILDFGAYLDGGALGEILLPRRYQGSNCCIGNAVEVFVYLDSEDRPIATTETPKAMLNQCAYLKVKALEKVGAFMDWGLQKDLLVPFSEQFKPLQVGYSYPVFIYLDNSGRIAGSCRLSKFLKDTNDHFKPGQQVDLLICERTDLGYVAAINHTHQGLIFDNDLLRPVKFGQQLSGYIKQIRNDKKIDLCLQLSGQQGRDQLSQAILKHLKENHGTSDLTDKSSPQAIYRQFGVSKASYKRALGNLYKQRLIDISKQAVKLSKS